MVDPWKEDEYIPQGFPANENVKIFVRISPTFPRFSIISENELSEKMRKRCEIFPFCWKPYIPPPFVFITTQMCFAAHALGFEKFFFNVPRIF